MQQSQHVQGSLPQQVSLIPIEQITLRQEQLFTGEEGTPIRELAASICRDGLIQPITVRPRNDGRYTVVSGNRRLLACRMCGMSQIEAVILSGDQQSGEVRALMEALTAGAMDELEEAEALHRLCVQGSMSPSILARRIGCTESSVAKRLTLMSLSDEVRNLLRSHHLQAPIAYALLRLPDDETRLSIARLAARQRLSVSEVELLIASKQHPAAPASAASSAPSAPGGHAALVVRDERLYLNAIRTLVNQMQDAGLPAVLSEQCLGSQLQLTIRMPMQRRRRAERHQHVHMDTASLPQ